jgi:7-cyano-7-deazaguanine reductase
MTNTPAFVGDSVLGRSDAVGGGLVGIELSDSNRNITYKSDEVTSFCPVTGQPDFYTVIISAYKPPLGIESKSLKLYLQSFNDKEKAQFCEKFADTILGDVLKAMSVDPGTERMITPEMITVIVKQKARGGITIEAISEFSI